MRGWEEGWRDGGGGVEGEVKMRGVGRKNMVADHETKQGCG
jgi:hypothetical protein